MLPAYVKLPNDSRTHFSKFRMLFIAFTIYLPQQPTNIIIRVIVDFSRYRPAELHVSIKFGPAHPRANLFTLSASVEICTWFISRLRDHLIIAGHVAVYWMSSGAHVGASGR